MAPKSVTFRRHDHLVSVLFGDLLWCLCCVQYHVSKLVPHNHTCMWADLWVDAVTRLIESDDDAY